MSFGMYSVGYLILIGGVVYLAHLMHIPEHYIISSRITLSAGPASHRSQSSTLRERLRFSQPLRPYVTIIKPSPAPDSLIRLPS